MRTPAPTIEHWNVLVTTRNSRQRDVRRALAPVQRLFASGLRNVLIGQVDDMDVLLAGIEAACERQPFLRHWIGHVRPIERTFALDLPSFPEQLERECAGFLDRVGGRTFHVRVARRGNKGHIDTHATEVRLGAFLHDTLVARGLHPTVTFRDPDFVVTVDVLRDIVGLSIIPRALRQRSPFIKVT